MIKKYLSIPLIYRMIGGLFLGVILALIPKGETDYLSIIESLGEVFIQLLVSIAPVLVFILVMASIASAKTGIGKRMRTVILLYIVSTLLAAFISVIIAKLFPVAVEIKSINDVATHQTLKEILSNLVLKSICNPLKAIIEANYTGVLFWAILFGFAIKKTATLKLANVLNDLSKIIGKIINWIIQFAPFGILGLVFKAVRTSGIEIFTTYGKLVLLLLAGMLIVILITDPLIVAIVTKRNPYPLVFKCLKESGITAFFTRSSASNIPINLDLCEKMGVNKDFYSVSIPLGSTVNMNGAAVTITIISLVFAGSYGMEVSLGMGFVVSVIAAIGACGSSGIAGGSMMLIPLACSTLGLPVEVGATAMSVCTIIGVIQDSMETAINSSTDAIFTIAVDQRIKRIEDKK